MELQNINNKDLEEYITINDLIKCNTESEFINKIISKESNFFKNSIIAISRPSGNINKIEENIKK